MTKIKLYGNKGYKCQILRIGEGFLGLGNDIVVGDDYDFIYSNNFDYSDIDSQHRDSALSQNGFKIFNVLDIPPHIPDKYFSSWAQYSMVLPEGLNRYQLMEKLNKNDIPSMVYYKIPNHLQEGYRQYDNQEGDFKVTEDISKKILSLPMHPYLDKDSQDKVLGVINDVN